MGADHIQVALSQINLADLYKLQKNALKAERLYKRSMEIEVDAFGPNHPQVALIQRALADLYTIEEKYTKAEQFNKQALANIEKALGPNHPETGESLYKMAEMYYLKKNYNKAIELLNRSLLIKENFYGNENINLLPTLELMFNLTKTQGDKKKLKVLKSRIKRIRSKDQS